MTFVRTFSGDKEGTTEMEECLERLEISKHADPENEKTKMDQLQQSYEDSMQHKSQLPPYGIKEVNKICPYPVEFGKMKSAVCKEEIERRYTLLEWI